MPSETPRQARFMRAELGRAERGQKTVMSKKQLREFTHMRGGPPAEGYRHLGRFATGRARKEYPRP